jgi:hypothetical protein
LAVAAGATGAVALAESLSATSANPGNSVSLGTVSIGDNDSGSTLFNLSGLTPTSTTPVSKCIAVTYTGSLPVAVRLYGVTGGTGLDQYLHLTVTRGSGGDANCNGFTAEGAPLYDGTLQGYADDFVSGIADPQPSWATGDSHQYKLDASVQSGTTGAQMQGLTATQQFVWEARNQ